MPVLVAMQEKIAKAVDWARACATAFVFSFVDLFRFQSATVSRVADCVMPFDRSRDAVATVPSIDFHRRQLPFTVVLLWRRQSSAGSIAHKSCWRRR